MSYLMNTWYCARWSDDLPAGTPVPVTLLDRSVVLFREADGKAAAVDNRCSHRFAPLDRGQIREGRLQCGYHGLVFDGRGRCLHNPHGKGAIPAAAHIRAYPVVERFGAIWLWMGDSEPNESLLPDFSDFDPAIAYAGRRYLHAKAHYELDVDNILDLSHIQYLHGDTLGSASVSAARTDVVQDGSTVHSRRLVTNEVLTPFLEKAFFVAPGQRVDRSLDVRWNAPASMLLTVTVTATGRPPEEGHARRIAHIFTPETATTSHYFFALAYPKTMGPDAAGLAQRGIAGLAVPFETEDLPMLEAQQAVIGEHDFAEMRPIMLEGDAGATRARRVLARMIADEVGASTILQPPGTLATPGS